MHSVTDEVTDNQNLNEYQYIKQTSTQKTPEINKIKKRLFMSDGCIETKKLKSQHIVSSKYIDDTLNILKLSIIIFYLLFSIKKNTKFIFIFKFYQRILSFSTLTYLL